MFTSDDRRTLEDHGKDISDLFRRLDGVDKAIQALRNQFVYLDKDLDALTDKFNHNASSGNDLVTEVRDIQAREKKISEAIDLLASALGKQITTVPEVPAKITLTPGRPEKLALVKATKHKPLAPQATTVEVYREDLQ